MPVKEKQSNYEMLRIISMLLIIGYHLYEHTETLMWEPLSVNKFVSMLIGSWGIVGVDCFVLISAWFMVDSVQFKFERLIGVIVQTTFYSVLLYVGVQFVTDGAISIRELVKCFIGFAYDSYWFVTAYLVMMLLSPLLNLFVRMLSDSQLRKVVFLLFFVFLLWECLLWASPVNTIELFLFIYLLAAYMKRKKKDRWNNNRMKIFLTMIIGTLLFSCLVAALPESLRTSKIVKYIYITLLAKFSPVMLFIAITLFYMVSDWKIKSKYINAIGARTFSVYLIHENSFVYPKLLWGGACIAMDYFDKMWYPIWAVAVIGGIFVTCIVIDAVMQYLYKWISAMLCKIFSRSINEIDMWMNDFYR